jgi:uncharacterized membrane protein YcaP (DUF421 family)
MEQHKPFELARLLFNDLPPVFLAEVVFRTVIMFVVILGALRLTGKRGVKQLSVFETVIIIALGSAAGDPMFYEDVGLIPAILVFVVVILLYRLVTKLTGRYQWFERFIEGVPVCLIKEGVFAIEEFKKEQLAHDEFFSELRIKSVEHLGQVRFAYIEPSGEVSIYFYEDAEVRYGLPVRPELFDKRSPDIGEKGMHACSFCGMVAEVGPGKAHCENCGKAQWVPAMNTRRIS